jgi:hypothetical protein
MIRLFGFMVGSALAVGAMVLLLGIPEIRSPSVPEPAPVNEQAPLPQRAVEQPAPVPTPEPAPEPTPAPQPLADTPPPPSAPAELKWHSFWSPFGSQIAANGFVSRLEAVTGYDFRVVKVDTGAYEVAFGYDDETERRDKLSVIASATGLELPES